MRLMRKHHPQLQEDGFHALLPHAREFVPELMREFGLERDHGLRCWLLELLRAARDPRALPLFVEQLDSGDESLRDWAIYRTQGHGHARGTQGALRCGFEHSEQPVPADRAQGAHRLNGDVMREGSHA